MKKSDSTSTCPNCHSDLPDDSPQNLCPTCLMQQALASRTMMEPGGSSPRSPLLSLEEVADKFSQFEILECLGRGGMGVVYKARQKSLNRMVAIKILAPERESEVCFSEHFAHEAELLAKLSHPHIVTIHDFGEADGLFYLVMEFVDGVNIRDLLSDGRLEAKQALAIVPPICEALEYAHAKGIIHRDIKPENLLLDREGRVKIADFGIASLVGAGSGMSGTPPYMAPEQQTGSVDRRSDIYALGVVLYEMLTGERPNQEVILPSKKIEVDVRIDEMVLRALEKKPERRYQTAHEFRTQVETMAEESSVQSQPQNDDVNCQPSKKSRVRVSWVTGGVIVLGIILLLFVGALLRESLARDGSEDRETLASSPHALRGARTARVIDAGLSSPNEPWAWQELERRSLSSTEVDRVLAGLTAWVEQVSPQGQLTPLNWISGMLEHFDDQGEVEAGQAVAFFKAVQGDLRMKDLLRMRVGERSLQLSCEWSYLWKNTLLGMRMMNELQAVKVDGEPVQFGNFSHFRQSWGSHSLNFELVLPELKPGLHMVELDVRSQIVNDEDLLGLSSAAPAEDWPTPINAWNRSVTQEFYVFAADEELVNLSVDASLDPVTEGALSIDEILVHSDGDGVSLVLPFQLDELPISVCFDVMLQLEKEQVACGTFWVALDSGGEMTMRSESNLRVELAQLETTLREVTVTLKPQVGAIEHVAAVDQIWGGEVVFDGVPLKRLGLGE